MNNVYDSEERVELGIDYLDRILKGGVPKGSMILVKGGPGTGKTTLAGHFLYVGAIKRGDPGLYFSFIEDEEKFMSDMRSLGMDFGGIKDKGLFRYVSSPILATEDFVEMFMEKLHKEILKLNAKRLVIDSLTPLIDILDRSRYRCFLRTALIPALKKLGITSLIITERMPDNIPHVYGEYLFDGLIELSIEERSRLIYRWLEVKKIRGVKIPSAKIPIAIVDGKGIVALYLEAGVKKPKAVQEVVSAGIPELDVLLGGGLRSSTSTLLKGPPGSGKQSIMLYMASEALRQGKKVLMVELLGNPEGLKHRLEQIINQREIKPQGEFKVIWFNFDKDSLFDSLAETTPYLVEEGYDYIVINGLEVIDKVLSEDYAWLAINSIIRTLRNSGKIMVATYSTTADEFTEHEDLFDNVIMLRLKIGTSKAKRCLAVTKTYTGVPGEKLWELTFEEGKIFLKEVCRIDEKGEERA